MGRTVIGALGSGAGLGTLGATPRGFELSISLARGRCLAGRAPSPSQRIGGGFDRVVRSPRAPLATRSRTATEAKQHCQTGDCRGPHGTVNFTVYPHTPHAMMMTY